MRLHRIAVCMLAYACSGNGAITRSEDGGSKAQDARHVPPGREQLERARPSLREVNRMIMDITSNGTASERDELLEELRRRGAYWPGELVFYLEPSERGPAVWGFNGPYVPEGDGWGHVYVLVVS